MDNFPEWKLALGTWLNTVLKNGKFTIWMRIFGQLLLVDEQKMPYVYKTTSKEYLTRKRHR